MRRFNLLKNSNRIEKHVLYSKLLTGLNLYLNSSKPTTNNAIRNTIEKILTDNGYSDLQFQVRYEDNVFNIDFDYE